MKCRNPECTAEVNPEALYCGRCGTPVMSVCPVCDAPIPLRKHTRSCSRCGAMISEMRTKTKEKTTARHDPDPGRSPSGPSAASGPAHKDAGHSGGGSVPAAPAGPLKTDRSLGMFILLNLVTLGIYSIVFYSKIGTDLNRIAGPHDGKKTMHFCLMFFLITPLTCGIGSLVWFHRMSGRVGAELIRRGYAGTFGSGTFWLWDVLGSLIVAGPLVYTHKLAEAMNILALDYNTH